jgi:hypothetical protein
MPEDNSHAGQGAVVLDIGGDIGALVVAAPAALDGVEIEIRPASSGPHGHRHQPGEAAEHEHHLPHVAVLGRPANGRILHSAVFPELSAGCYELYRRTGGPVELTVTIRGGEVTHADWPSHQLG